MFWGNRICFVTPQIELLFFYKSYFQMQILDQSVCRNYPLSRNGVLLFSPGRKIILLIIDEFFAILCHFTRFWFIIFPPISLMPRKSRRVGTRKRASPSCRCDYVRNGVVLFYFESNLENAICEEINRRAEKASICHWKWKERPS